MSDAHRRRGIDGFVRLAACHRYRWLGQPVLASSTLQSVSTLLRACVHTNRSGRSRRSWAGTHGRCCGSCVRTCITSNIVAAPGRVFWLSRCGTTQLIGPGCVPQDRCKIGWSINYGPEQIARRLVIDFPDDAEMRVSHETIYQSLYVQGRGALHGSWPGI